MDDRRLKIATSWHSVTTMSERLEGDLQFVLFCRVETGLSVEQH